MTGSDEIERAKQKLEEKLREHVAKRMLKISEEGFFFPSRLKTFILVLKIVCAVSIFVCGPIIGWLYTQLTAGILSLELLIIFAIPVIFLAIITAIVMTMKTPTD
jgi:hypothetical protein